MTEEENRISFDEAPLGEHAAQPAETEDANQPVYEPSSDLAFGEADDTALPSFLTEAALGTDAAESGAAEEVATPAPSPEDTADLTNEALLGDTEDFAVEAPASDEANTGAEADQPAETLEVAEVIEAIVPEIDPSETPIDATAPLFTEEDAGTGDTAEGTDTGSETDETGGPSADEDIPAPDTTAEIDVDAVEAKLNDPGSTASFAPITDERIDTSSTYDAGTNVQLMWGARSDVGCVRAHNEDSYLVQSPLFAVCDGMGGHAAGEVASSIAVETISKMAPTEADPARLAAAVEAANSAVIEAAANGMGKPGMGCTATCAYIQDTTLAIAHVGDSRAYLLHEGTLIRVTHDHSFVEELVDAGEITADEARVHPNRSVITRALGSDPAMYADHFSLTIEEGDRLILCSDGLSSMVPDREIERVATQSSTAQICVDNLVDAALAAGGHDNVTVIVVDVVDDGRMRELARKRKRNLAIMCGGVVAALLVAAIVSFFAITNSVYIGVHGENVAVYTGIHTSVLGVKLYHLEDDTTIELVDLPQDTQNRLREGIQQKSLDDAYETISKYRKQIDEELTKKAQDAETISNSTDEAAAAAEQDSADESTRAANQTASTEGGAA